MYEDIGNDAEIKQGLRDIDGDGIQSNDHKGKGPLFPPLHIDDPKEKTKQQQTPSSCIKHIGAGPDQFVNRKKQAPPTLKEHKKE